MRRTKLEIDPRVQRSQAKLTPARSQNHAIRQYLYDLDTTRLLAKHPVPFSSTEAMSLAANT